MSREKARTSAVLATPALLAARRAERSEDAAVRFDLRRSLRMHPVLAAASGLAVAALTAAVGLSRAPQYRAEARIYIAPAAPSLLGTSPDSGGYDTNRYESEVEQQVQDLSRQDILENAVTRLPAGLWRRPGEPVTAAANRLRHDLSITRIGATYQIAVDVTGTEPNGLAAAANAVAQAFLEGGNKDQQSIQQQKLVLLQKERSDLQQELDRDRADQRALSSSLGVADPGGQAGNPFDLQLEGLRTELTAAQQQHAIAAAQLESITGSNAAQAAGRAVAAEDLASADTGTTAPLNIIKERRATLAAQMAGLTHANPLYKQNQVEIAELDREVQTMDQQAQSDAEQHLQQRLRLELNRTADIESKLNAQLARQTSLATSSAARLQRASELAATIQRLTSRYAVVDDAVRGLELQFNGPGQDHLSVPAVAPVSPEPSRRRLFLLLALPLGLLAAVASATLRQRLDTRLYLPSDVEAALAFPALAFLPQPGEVSSATLAEYTLRLAAGVESAYRETGARAFVFTPVDAATESHGLMKDLDQQLRELGYRICILPAVSLFDTEVLPAEPAASRSALPRTPGEGFASTHLALLKQEHDLLLIEAPPLLQSGLAEYAARCTDATLLLAESARTRRTELLQATSLLERLNVSGLGVVLTGLKLSVAGPELREAIKTVSHAAETAAHQPPRPVEDRAVSAPSPTDHPAPASRPAEPEQWHEPPTPCPTPFLLSSAAYKAERQQASTDLDQAVKPEPGLEMVPELRPEMTPEPEAHPDGLAPTHQVEEATKPVEYIAPSATPRPFLPEAPQRPSRGSAGSRPRPSVPRPSGPRRPQPAMSFAAALAVLMETDTSRALHAPSDPRVEIIQPRSKQGYPTRP